MKLIIAGGRDIHDYSLISTNILENTSLEEIVSGGATGVDSLAIRFGKEHNVPVKVFPADWKKHGRAAGPIRNKQMAEYADYLLLIWDGSSRGSANMKSQMEKLGKRVEEIIVPANSK